MEVKRFSITIHVLIWILLLVIPYVSTDQVFNSLDASQYGIQCIGASEWFVLLPRYGENKKQSMGGNENDQHCKIKRNAKHRELSGPYNCLNHVSFKFSVVPVILLRKIPVLLINNFTLQ